MNHHTPPFALLRCSETERKKNDREKSATCRKPNTTPVAMLGQRRHGLNDRKTAGKQPTLMNPSLYPPPSLRPNKLRLQKFPQVCSSTCTPTGVCVARSGVRVCVCVCVWPEPALLRGIEVPMPALLTASLSSAGPALLRALAVPRDLTGTLQSDRHCSTGTTEGPVLYLQLFFRV